jgi:integrase
MPAERIVLTEDRIRGLKPPDRETMLWDRDVRGFGLRCYPSGLKRFIFQYRTGGRGAAQRRITLGEAGTLRLADARDAARKYAGNLAMGRDPQADRKEDARREASRLDRLLDAYEAHLGARGVVNVKAIMSLLRRELLGPLGKVSAETIRRRDVADRVARLEAAGKPGAAQDLRAKATTFFGWAVNRDLIYANPLAGWRRDRATRAQMKVRPGKALSADQLAAVWRACSAVPAPFGDYVRFLLLTGQRRSETALMRRADVDLEAGVWTIPAKHAKNGREHRIPLPPLAVAVIRRQERHAGDPHVFATGLGKPMSGWTKRQDKLIELSGVAFTLHDCRRTFRSGLTALGVESELAEIMINHVRDDLVERYDREPRWKERFASATTWADHVANLVRDPGSPVIDLASRAIA